MILLSLSACLIPVRRSVYTYWCICIIINASLPFFFALGMTTTLPQFLGVFAAVTTFICLYSEVDYRLLSQGKFDGSKQLRVSAALKPVTFLLPGIDLMTGALSIGITEALIKSVSWLSSGQEHLNLFQPQDVTGFWASYVITFIDGLLLSLLVGLILLMVKAVIRFRTPATTN